MRPTLVDTQKATMNEPNTCNTKIVAFVNPGQIQKISDCNIRDKPWCTLASSCGYSTTDNPIHDTDYPWKNSKQFFS
jgi:hypothetical protein